MRIFFCCFKGSLGGGHIDQTGLDDIDMSMDMGNEYEYGLDR